MILGIDRMPFNQCCKTCKYTRDLGPSSNTWCSLRKLKVQSDFAFYAFCHHWSQKDNSLSELHRSNLIALEQLDFARDLVVNESLIE